MSFVLAFSLLRILSVPVQLTFRVPLPPSSLSAEDPRQVHCPQHYNGLLLGVTNESVVTSM